MDISTVQIPNGVLLRGCMIYKLMDIGDSSVLQKLYHVTFCNQRTRTHFPSPVQSCTLAGVMDHFLFTLGNW